MSRVVVRCVVALAAFVSLYVLMNVGSLRSTIADSYVSVRDSPFRQEIELEVPIIEIPIPITHTSDEEPPVSSVAEDPTLQDEGPTLWPPEKAEYCASDVWAAQGYWETKPGLAYVSPLSKLTCQQRYC